MRNSFDVKSLELARVVTDWLAADKVRMEPGQLQARIQTQILAGMEWATRPSEPVIAPAVGGDGVAIGWRCFHCDETFTSERCARLHFGREEGATPACQIKGSEHGLVEALRRAEEEASDAWMAIHNETTDAAKAYHAQRARHAQQLRTIEQIGYDRGLADAKAHPETLGLTSVPPTPTGGGREVEAVVDDRTNRPPEPTSVPADAGAVPLSTYDAGLLSDHGGGDVDWWWDYIRAELGRAHEFYASQWSSGHDVEFWKGRFQVETRARIEAEARLARILSIADRDTTIAKLEDTLQVAREDERDRLLVLAESGARESEMSWQGGRFLRASGAMLPTSRAALRSGQASTSGGEVG